MITDHIIRQQLAVLVTHLWYCIDKEYRMSLFTKFETSAYNI